MRGVRARACRRRVPLGLMGLLTSATLLLAGRAQAHTSFVTIFADWKYDISGKDLGTAWRDSSFDDAAWPVGESALGVGDPSYGVKYRTSFPVATISDPTRYMRIAFTLGDARAKDVTRLVLRAGWAHGFVAYLNGKEIARRQLPPTPATISFATAADKHVPTALEDVDLPGAAGFLVDGKNVLAVELHQTAPPTDIVVWAGQLLFETSTPHLTRGPYLQTVTRESAVIRFRTNQEVAAEVRYGVSMGDTSKVATDGATREHAITLRGLSPGTKYFYSVGVAGSTLAGGDALLAFVTAPAAGTSTPLRIWVLGDSGTQNDTARRVRDAYYAFTKERPTDLWLMLGDNAYPNGKDDEYQFAVFENMFEPTLRTSSLWPTFGNHDWGDGVSNSGKQTGPYFDTFTLPTKGEAGGEPSGTEAYYAFDHGNAHFVCLDTQEPTLTMVDWLKADLTKNTLPWTVVFFHVPPYTKGTHDSDADGGSGVAARQAFAPVFDEHGVDLVLTGHSHDYERSILLHGHYGLSSEFKADPGKFTINGGDGREGSGGPYVKPALPGPKQGTVYVVNGNSGGRGDDVTKSLDHPVMVKLTDPHTGLTRNGAESEGSLVIDLAGNRLDARYLDFDGHVIDTFTILKGSSASPPDGGVAPDAGATPPASPESTGGCGCGFRDSQTGSFALLALALGGAALSRRGARKS